MTAPGRLHPNIVCFAVQILLSVHQRIAVRLPLIRPALGRRGLPVLGVKVERIGRQRLAVCPVIDIEIKRVRPARAFIGHGNARMLGKRHRKKTVQSLISAHRQRRRLIQVIIPQPQPKEIPNRRLNARR